VCVQAPTNVLIFNDGDRCYLIKKRKPSLSNEQENIDIINGCKKGDRKAQEKLYRNYYRAMMTICLRYTKNDEDAVEVLNTGFLKVFKNIQRYDSSQATLYTWIRTVVMNSCLDFVKQKQKLQKVSELNDESDVHIAPEVINKIKAAELIKQIRTLTPATRAVFNLYVIEGYSHKEIADILNISTGTSKWHLSEARKNLQQLINEPKIKIS
jgi:RNA polymerase sigma-70 factor (ECF subfamily)